MVFWQNRRMWPPLWQLSSSMQKLRQEQPGRQVVQQALWQGVRQEQK